MKNIHVLKTDKPSRLFKLAGDLHLHKECEIDPKRNQNIYITSDEEIKEGDWCICLENIFKNEIFKVDSDTPNKSSNVTLEFAKKYLTKIILTTDQDLIEDGVQAINDEFLEWFVKNPSCEDVGVSFDFKKFRWSDLNKEQCYKIIIPSEEPKQETTLEEASERFTEVWFQNDYFTKELFIAGAKWQQEQILDFLYSEITERRDYSASKMCEKVIEFIEQFKNK